MGDLIDVSGVMIAIDATVRPRVQARLREIAERGDSASRSGLAAMLRSAIAEMRAARAHWTHAGVQNALPMPVARAQEHFQKLAYALRARFATEVIRNAGGSVQERPAPPQTERPLPGVAVVSFVVAARRELADVHEPPHDAVIDQVLAAFESLAADDLVAIEVIWAPADPNEKVSIAELEAKWPELRKLV